MPGNKEFNEELLLEKLKEGDIMSLELLYKEFGNAIYAYALALTKRKELAEDAVTDAFIQTYEYIQKNKNIKSLRALLYTICRNKAYDALKFRARTDYLPEFEELPDEAFPFDKRVEVKLAVEALPSPEKEIVILYCVHELKHKEIAQILKLPEGTVRWKYRNALKLLKKSLVA